MARSIVMVLMLIGCVSIVLANEADETYARMKAEYENQLDLAEKQYNRAVSESHARFISSLTRVIAIANTRGDAEAAATFQRAVDQLKSDGPPLLKTVPSDDDAAEDTADHSARSARIPGLHKDWYLEGEDRFFIDRREWPRSTAGLRRGLYGVPFHVADKRGRPTEPHRIPFIANLQQPIGPGFVVSDLTKTPLPEGKFLVLRGYIDIPAQGDWIITATEGDRPHSLAIAYSGGYTSSDDHFQNSVLLRAGLNEVVFCVAADGEGKINLRWRPTEEADFTPVPANRLYHRPNGR